MATDDAGSSEGIERSESVDAGEDRENCALVEDSAITCPVCDSPDYYVFFEPIEASVDDGEIKEGETEAPSAESLRRNRIQRQPGTVLRCKRCKVGFRQVRPDEATLAKFYEERDVSPYLCEIPGRRWTARRHWELVKPLMLLGHVLDIGCGSGLFLEQVGRGGWTGTGIEPSQALCDYARDQMSVRVNVIGGTLESSGFPPRLFDVITLWNVLEQTPKPAEFLRASSVPLKPGGYVLVRVPYIDSIAAQLMGRRWPPLLPEHLNYFSRKSLLHCAETAGLTLERFARRSSIFSLGHVMRRLAEHEIPLASGLKDLVSSLKIEDWLLPVPLGDIVAILRKPND